MTFTNTMAISGSLFISIIIRCIPEIGVQIDLRVLQKVVFLAVPPFINDVLLIVTLHYICTQYGAA